MLCGRGREGGSAFSGEKHSYNFSIVGVSHAPWALQGVKSSRVVELREDWIYAFLLSDNHRYLHINQISII